VRIRVYAAQEGGLGVMVPWRDLSVIPRQTSLSVGVARLPLFHRVRLSSCICQFSCALALRIPHACPVGCARGASCGARVSAALSEPHDVHEIFLSGCQDATMQHSVAVGADR
jgi:hypothetical protein